MYLRCVKSSYHEFICIFKKWVRYELVLTGIISQKQALNCRLWNHSKTEFEIHSVREVKASHIFALSLYSRGKDCRANMMHSGSFIMLNKKGNVKISPSQLMHDHTTLRVAKARVGLRPSKRSGKNVIACCFWFFWGPFCALATFTLIIFLNKQPTPMKEGRYVWQLYDKLVQKSIDE